MCTVLQEIGSFIQTVGLALYSFVSSDFFVNFVSLLELILAIVTIIIGGEKVKEFIHEYKRKRVSATFGFYVNLGYFIKRLRPLIVNDSGKPMKTLYLLSSSESVRNQANGFEQIGDKLSALAYECLQYLSTEANQIPPSDYNEAERKTWKKEIDVFVDYLNQFYLIGSGIHLPTLESEAGIINYCNGIQNILDNIEKKAKKAIEDFYQDMINEKEVLYNKNDNNN